RNVTGVQTCALPIYIYGCWRSMTDGLRCILRCMLRCIGRIICSFGRRTGMRTYWRMDYVYTDGLRCMLRCILRCIYGCNCVHMSGHIGAEWRISGDEVAYMWRWDSVFVAMR